MFAACLSFLSGVIAIQQLPALPEGGGLLLLAALAAGCGYWRRWTALCLLAGLLWASVWGWLQLEHRLDEAAAGEYAVQGYIADLPQQHPHYQRFDFVVTEPSGHFPSTLRLSWYQPTPPLAAGQAWAFTVKLKPPHGRLNPGSFDYEAWLFANGIGATGYVRPNPAPKAIIPPPSLRQAFAAARQGLADAVDRALPHGQQTGLLKALTLGTQNSIDAEAWAILRSTGTLHLLVISGSHISLIAGLIYLISRRAWARWGSLRLAPPRVAALIAWLAALFYAGLAGYSIPTLRAVIMLSVALLALSTQRHSSAWRVLLLAVVAVVVVDPLAVLAVGFWLSFMAVALLLFVSSGRLQRPRFWHEAGRAQWATSLGLAPLLLLFFQQLSLISPLANALAVPVIGLVITPLALLGMALLILWPPLATPLLMLCDALLQALWRGLEQLATLPWASISLPQPPLWAALLACIGCLWLLTPRGIPAHYLGWLLLLPLLAVQPQTPPQGSVWLTVLDVGQGLAAVIQTKRHALVFDTGGKSSEQSDMGESVLLPFLRYQGIAQLDQLIISHGDNDHSGGAASLLQQLPVTTIRSSDARWAQAPKASVCRAGEAWEWDGVRFTLLSPPNTAFDKENDNSCVLQIATPTQQLLLTGDIEATAEHWLVAEYGEALRSSVLVAPHHGSKTSSSAVFLQQVKPQWIVIPAGYRNRFGFPHPSVLARYQQQGISWLNTAEQGAVSVALTDEGVAVGTERQRKRRYWMANATTEASASIQPQ